jgi:hypothetical protein
MWTLDPFGNYLCQKLLEYSTDEQRNLICESVAGDLVTISLNMHGTRAVQKMIDFLSTQRQVSVLLPIPTHCTTSHRVCPCREVGGFLFYEGDLHALLYQFELNSTSYH